MKDHFPWTAEYVQMLRDMWPNYSGTQIARKLSRLAGHPLSRRAVTGKVYRIGMKKKTDRAAVSLSRGKTTESEGGNERGQL